MDFDKPFRTFEELAVLLRDEHGLAIGNIEETVQVLRFIPYYDLVNGYKDVLMYGERFRYPFNITDLLLFHSFDRNFQSSLMSFSTTVEDYFKNVLAYVIAKIFLFQKKSTLMSAITQESILTLATILPGMMFWTVYEKSAYSPWMTLPFIIEITTTTFLHGFF